MAAGWLLTLLALSGVWAGVYLGRSTDRYSEHFAAAGGGLLFGISLFWLVPEIGETSGRAFALLMACLVALAMAGLEATLSHSGRLVRHGVVWPLLLATAVHSLLDGWSVRALSLQPLTHVAATVGLALHKVPEGAAVGWVTRRSLGSANRAMLMGGAAELFTLGGAFAEPAVNASASARFGIWWTASILSVIAGGFLFLAFHAVMPHWRQRPVMAIFLATFLLVGAVAFIRTD